MAVTSKFWQLPDMLLQLIQIPLLSKIKLKFYEEINWEKKKQNNGKKENAAEKATFPYITF